MNMNISVSRSLRTGKKTTPSAKQNCELFLLLKSTVKTVRCSHRLGGLFAWVSSADRCIRGTIQFETAENTVDKEDSYEGCEDANAPVDSDDDDEEEEKERNEERMCEVTNGEDEVLKKPEDAVDDPERVNSIPEDPIKIKWHWRRRRRRRRRRGWGKK